MLKNKIQLNWLMISVLFVAVVLFGVKSVYAYLDVIRFTGEELPASTDACPNFSATADSDGNKLDTCTGLKWKAVDETKDSPNQNIPFTWNEAMTRCSGNYRLPTIDELFSLVNPKGTDKSPLVDVPTTGEIISLGTYWSKTEYTPNTAYARSVNFGQGTADNVIYGKTVGLKVRCVSTSFCGNGNLETGEACDGSNLGGQTCVGLGQGYIGGTLGCSSCQFETTDCFKTIIKPTEVQVDANSLDTCTKVCGSLNPARSCLSVGTKKGWCKNSTTGALTAVACNNDAGCSASEKCQIDGNTALNGFWNKRMLRTPYWACEEVGVCSNDQTKFCTSANSVADCGTGVSCIPLPAIDGCSTTMTGVGDICGNRGTPWAYCQCQ